jgi:hypothetical protein
MKQPKTDQQIKLAQLKSRYQQLKKKKAKSQGEVREMLRLKALMAYYRGMKLEVVAQAYEVGVKTLREWIKQFEAEQGLRDQARSGRPAKLASSNSSNSKPLSPGIRRRCGQPATCMCWWKRCLGSAMPPSISRNCCGRWG